MKHWHEEAACKDVDATAEGFYATRRNTMDASAALNAISWCRTCTVADACLEDARAYNDCGVRGGVMRLEPWHQTDEVAEISEDQLRQIINGPGSGPTYQAPSGRSCSTCGRRGLKRRPDGALPRHVDHSHGGWCEGNQENAA